MRFVASWSMEPYLHGKSGKWESTSHLLACMVLCLNNVKRLYGKNLILYTDSITEHVLSELTDNVDIINVYDDVFEKHNVPLSFWCYPKLLTFREQTEPYIHIDLDFIIKRKIPEGWLDHELIIQCYEDLEYMERDSRGLCFQELYNRDKVKHLYQWSEWWDDPKHNYKFAVNVGIMGMNNMDLNKRYCDIMFEFIDNNKDAMVKYADTEWKIVPVVIEQQSLYHLTQEMNIDILSTMGMNSHKPPINRIFTHFVGDWMKKSPVPFAVEQRDFLLKPKITQDIQTMSDYIDERVEY